MRESIGKVAIRAYEEWRAHGITLREIEIMLECIRRVRNIDDTADALRLENERKNFLVTRVGALARGTKNQQPEIDNWDDSPGEVIEYEV